MKVSKIVSGYRGMYNRIALKVGVDPSYVSRIASGDRQNSRIEQLLRKEIISLHQLSAKYIKQK